MKFDLEIKTYRKKFAIFAGKTRMTHLMKNEGEAISYLEKNRAILDYYAGSAGVSVENTEPIIVHAA